MPALPPSSDFTGASVTEGGFKTAITALRDYLNGLLGADGTLATAQSTLGAIGGSYVAKSAGYTVIASDRGKVIGCAGTFTLALTAAATLGSGFSFIVANVGTGLITIDPNSSEQINGATTITVSPGEEVFVTCNGTAWIAYSKFNIGALTADSAPDTAADKVLVWDASLATWKAVLIDNLGGGGMKLLGTLTTTSGSVQTLSGLDLTSYREIICHGAGVSATNTTAAIRFSANSTSDYNCTQAASSAADTFEFMLRCELSGTVGVWNSISSRNGGMQMVNLIGVSGYSTSTTSISFYTAAGNFDAGSIKVFGVK